MQRSSPPRKKQEWSSRSPQERGRRNAGVRVPSRPRGGEGVILGGINRQFESSLEKREPTRHVSYRSVDKRSDYGASEKYDHKRGRGSMRCRSWYRGPSEELFVSRKKNVANLTIVVSRKKTQVQTACRNTLLTWRHRWMIFLRQQTPGDRTIGQPQRKYRNRGTTHSSWGSPVGNPT